MDLTADQGETTEQEEPTQAVANDDAFSINEDTPSTGNLADNDTLLGGETYQIAEGGAPANGTLEITTDGVFFYTPDENYSGEDSFTYTIVSADGQISTATVSLSVVPVNDAPIAQDDQLICPEDESLTSINLVANDVDPDGDALTIVDVQSSNGADITFNEDGTINYKPAPNYVGTDTLTYTVEDGAGGVSTATITVEVTPVNDAPVAQDFALTTTQDESINSIDVLSSASDVDGDTISMVSGESSSGGVVQINADGTMSYTPPAGFVGTDIVTYSVQDSAGAVVEAKVTITVDPIDEASGGSSGGDGSITDGSGDGTSTGSGGSEGSGDGTSTGSGGSEGSGDGTSTGSGENGGAGDGTSAGPNGGGDTGDGAGSGGDGSAGGGANGGTGSGSGPNSGTGGGSGDAPDGGIPEGVVLTPEEALEAISTTVNVSTDEDTPLQSGGVASNVASLSQFLDVSTFSVAEAPQNGSIQLDQETGDWTYTPATNFFGEDEFSVSVIDGEGNEATRVVSVTVLSVNDAPIVVNESVTTDEDVGIASIDVLSNDSDVESDELSVQSAVSVNGGVVSINDDGSLNYQPPANFNGTDTIEYVVADGNGGESPEPF